MSEAPPQGRVLRLERLTKRALDALDRAHAIAFWPIGPLEVHGPHLPLGTDGAIAERVLERVAARWVAGDAQRVAVQLPTLFLGADVLPIAGSLQVPSDVLLRAVTAVGAGVARAGFRALVLGNFHGGPRHMLALEQARRRISARSGMLVVNPFGAFVRAIHERAPAAMTRLQFDPASPVGGPRDAHAGTFETSVALAAFADAVGPEFRALPPSEIGHASRSAGLVRWLARCAARGPARLGQRAARELQLLAGLLDWIALRPVPSYVGAPAAADAELGERGLEAMAWFTEELLARGLAGEDLDAQSAPPLWALRAVTWIPW